jgi:hypothetical protein
MISVHVSHEFKVTLASVQPRHATSGHPVC